MPFFKVKSLFFKVLFGLLLLATAYFYRLDTPVMWGDEAGTAIFSKSILRSGFPVGFDGRNLMVFGNCAAVNDNLLEKEVTWGQYYMGAMSIRIFGESSAGVRVLFALVGLCSFFPLYAVLKKKSAFPLLITTLILLLPQVVFLQRNARYYPILVLLFSTLLWVHFTTFKSEKARVLLTTCISVLFFQTHQFAALCSLLGFVVYAALKQRDTLKTYLLAFSAGFMSWVAFWVSLRAVPVGEYAILRLLFEDFSKWISIFAKGIAVHLLDLDFINVIPVFAWAVVLILILSLRSRKELLRTLGDSLNQIIMINLAVQILAHSALLGYESKNQYAIIRFMPHLIAVAMIPLLLTIEKVVDKGFSMKTGLKRSVVITAFLIVCGLNIFSMTNVFKMLPERHPRVSWWPPVYAEILNPKPDTTRDLFGVLQRERDSDMDVLWVWPRYMNEVINFYMGGRYLIVPSLTRGTECEQRVVKKIGEAHYDRFLNAPAYLISFEKGVRYAPRGYEAKQIPLFRARPDASRPELTRHDFATGDGVIKGYINVFKRGEWGER